MALAPRPAAGGNPRLARLAPLLLSGEGGAAERPGSAATPPASRGGTAETSPRLLAVGEPSDPVVTAFLATRLALALRERGLEVRLVDASGAAWFRDAVSATAEPLATLTPGAPLPGGWGEVVVVALPEGSLLPYLGRARWRGLELVVAVGEGREGLARGYARLREGVRLLAAARLGVTPLAPDRDAARATFRCLARACRTLLGAEVVSDGYLPATAAALRRAGGESLGSPEPTGLGRAIDGLAALLLADGAPAVRPSATALATLLQPM